MAVRLLTLQFFCSLACAPKFQRTKGQFSAAEASLYWYDVKSRQKTAALYTGHVHMGPGAGIAVNHNSQYVAWVAGRNLCILRVGVLPLGGNSKRRKSSKGDKGFKATRPSPILLPHRRKLSALAFHPSQMCAATGDQDGVILLWYLSPEHLKTPQASLSSAAPAVTLHWHAHDVRCLSFSADGNHLLSGGDEAVLVTWQLETRDRSFLPRLGSNISVI